MKKAVVVGCRGQDGRLLSELLHSKGTEVVGIGKAQLDVTSRAAVAAFVDKTQPEEIYYLPAYHHAAEDRLEGGEAALFEKSFAVHVTGLLNFLEAVRERSARTRLFYAASSHVFGAPESPVQTESTPMNPTSVYGITKAAGVQCCRYYRAMHGIFAAVGILYNHESVYRRPAFVSQKIVQGALAVKRGETDTLTLGDLSARVDWGYAPDYVEAMTRVLALPEPDDFIVATGEAHTVGEFAEAAFGSLGLDWRAHVLEKAGLLTKGKTFFCGDAGKLRARTGWQPSVDFRGMVRQLMHP